MTLRSDKSRFFPFVSYLFLGLLVLCGSGCIHRSRHADYVVPYRITGSVMDVADGRPLDGVLIRVRSDTIPYLREPIVGIANGAFDLEYLLQFGRKERIPWLGEFKGPQDEIHFVFAREGYSSVERVVSLRDNVDCQLRVLEFGDVVLGPISP